MASTAIDHIACLLERRSVYPVEATQIIGRTSWSALAADAVVLMQLTDLADSGLSGKIQHIPENMYDLDADWEIDPKSLTLMENIGTVSIKA